LNRLSYENLALPKTRNAFGARILPHETFKQYFSLLLALGNDNSSFSQITAGFRERIAELVFENKVVTAFVDVCPGLEPSVLLGKLYWEATQGKNPEEQIPWRYVVVDAPSTGHGIMLFKSAFALAQVFSQGIIFKQAVKMKSFFTNPSLCKLHLVTIPEELPIQESLEMKKSLEEIDVKPFQYIINRCPPAQVKTPIPSQDLDSRWLHEIHLQFEIWNEQHTLIDKLKETNPNCTTLILPEIPEGLDSSNIHLLSRALNHALKGQTV
jgi:anion-transporting  ArsA/GET3 family ATPase